MSCFVVSRRWPAADFVTDQDVDRHNFLPLETGARLSWLRPGSSMPLEALGTRGEDHAEQLFEINTLVLRPCVTPSMMRTVLPWQSVLCAG